MNPLVSKLSAFADLTADDIREINDLCADVRFLRARTDLIEEGDRPEAVFLLLDGWAMRYKVLPDGKRQIMAFLLPGDLCDVRVFILKEMDHSIGLLSDARVAVIPKQKMLDLINERPKLSRALWLSSLVDESILREWLVNIGQRNGRDRLAHLLAELWHRLDAVGLAEGNMFHLPLTQADLGDTLGRTSVHVNRMLRELREGGLIEQTRNILHILDVHLLVKAARFEANYLHLDRRESRTP